MRRRAMRTFLRQMVSLAIIAIFVGEVALMNAVPLSNEMWKIEFTLSNTSTSVKAGQVVILNVTVYPLVKTYDFRLEITSKPVQVFSDYVLSFTELPSGVRQVKIFQGKIPDNAVKATEYQIGLKVEGYKNPPMFDLWGWRPHKFLFWGDDPIPLESGTLNSIKLTVV